MIRSQNVDRSSISLDNAYTYYAYISYKRREKKWASRMQRELQAYRLPSKLQQEYPDKAERLEPVFRDETDATAGLLHDEVMSTALRESKFLIVMCSKLAHDEPKEINWEIAEFLKTHSASQIIPFIIDKSDRPEVECFPSQLQELCKNQPLIGPNIFEVDFHQAFLKVVAKMHGLHVDELESFDAKRRKRKRVTVSLFATVFGLAAIVGGCFAFQYYAPHRAYYADYTTVFGIPQGIHSVNAHDVKQMAEHYTIITQRGAVRELRHENVKNKLTKHTDPEKVDRPTRAIYEYLENGDLDKVTYYDMYDRETLVCDYSSSGRIVDIKGNPSISEYSDYSFQPTSLTKTFNSSTGAKTIYSYGWMDSTFTEEAGNMAFSGIVRYLVDYTQEGFLREIRYASEPIHNTAARDQAGRYGIRYERNDLGQVIAEWNLICGGEGVSANDVNAYEVGNIRGGIKGKTYRYVVEDEGLSIICTYLNEDNEPTYNSSKWASRIQEYDSNYNLMKESFLGRDLSPVGYGYVSTASYEYEKGLMIRKEMFNGKDSVIVDVSYDSTFGYPGRVEYRNRTEHYLVITAGYSIEKATYDSKGRMIKVEYFDGNGDRCPSNRDSAMGAAIITTEYNKEGFPSVLRFYDAYENPMIDFAEQRSVFSETGMLKEAWSYDQNGNKTITDRGYSGIVFEYDDRGNKIQETYYGVDDIIMACADGYAIRRIEYDDAGNRTKALYYDAAGNLLESLEQILDKYGNATDIISRDENGTVTTEFKAQYDVHGNRISISGYIGSADLWSTNYFEYDGFGNELREYWKDESGKETTSKRFQYDEREYTVLEAMDNEALQLTVVDYYGLELDKAFFDQYGKDAKLIIGPGGYAAATKKYDEFGNGIENRYYGTDRHLMVISEGYAIAKSEYDLRGNLTRISFFGTDEKPTNCKDGYQSVSMEYDLNNKICAMHFFDSNGRDITTERLQRRASETE